MASLWNALFDSSLDFLRNAFLVGIISSVAFGIIGTFVVVKRISYMAGAISHSVLGGIGLGLYLTHVRQISFFPPMVGAVVAALASALIIWGIKRTVVQREDTVIGALWAFGMGVGLIFIAITPGYIDASSYLFGSILLVNVGDLWIIICLDIIILFVVGYFYNRLVAICFDEEFARVRGINAGFYELVLLCLVALTVVLLINVVGIVLIIALLTIPSAIASLFSRRLSSMMLLSTLVCLISNLAGLIVSYLYDLPSGPSIIIVATMIYLLALIGIRGYR